VYGRAHFEPFHLLVNYPNTRWTFLSSAHQVKLAVTSKHPLELENS